MPTSATVDYSQFFLLEDPLADRPLRLGIVSWEDFYASWEYFRGEAKPAQPIRLKAKMGGQATDFLWSTGGDFICVSSRVVELLRQSALTGWDTYPVEVYGRKGELIPGYSGLVITGAECREDLSRSVIVDKPPRVPGGEGFQVYKGLYFYEEDWDGSDFFLVGRRIVVTAQVYQLFKRAKVRNVMLTPLPEYETEVDFIQIVRGDAPYTEFG